MRFSGRTSCSRVRLSAEGQLYTCLFAAAGHDLKTALRAGASDDELREHIGSANQRRILSVICDSLPERVYLGDLADMLRALREVARGGGEGEHEGGCQTHSDRGLDPARCTEKRAQAEAPALEGSAQGWQP